MSKPIILIDDEKKFAVMLHELLEGNGYEADYCLNPEEALIRLKQENYELVITDYKMPQMDGAEFLHEVRRINPDLPVIMISGLMNMPELIKVANIGVTLVLEKPFNIEDLLENVSRFVKPSDEEHISAEEMDMQASEISFQQEKVTVTYPNPASFLSDASNENKRFLEILWNSANNCRHLPFFAHKNAEIRLVAKEIMNWTGQDIGAEVVRIDFTDTDKDITRDWFMGSDGSSGVLMVDMRNVDFDEASLAKFASWVKFVETCGKDISMLRVLYVMPLGARLELSNLDLEQTLLEMFSTEFPVLLSLRDRLLDVATYIKKMLGKKGIEAIGSDGLAQLLHFPWPGGYAELSRKIKKISEMAEQTDDISTDQMSEILYTDESVEKPSTACLNVETYLMRRQREYILLHRKQHEDLKDTILRLGIDSNNITVDDVMQNKALAFPGILNN